MWLFLLFLYFQFFSTLFAPLGFFADKMESFMPSSFWHQLTRIWPHLCLTHTHTHTHTHSQYKHTQTPVPLQILGQKVFALLSSALLSTCCIVIDYVGWGCINTVRALLRCSPTLFQHPSWDKSLCCNKTGSSFHYAVSTLIDLAQLEIDWKIVQINKFLSRILYSEWLLCNKFVDGIIPEWFAAAFTFDWLDSR